ncbi:MAG: hypothetical protein J6W29_08225 [Neisseriaceae bacterium]|nr:hypothetical protein [Neisseriaceae bacterium]
MRGNLLTMKNGSAKMFWLTPNFVSGNLKPLPSLRDLMKSNRSNLLKIRKDF